MRYQVIQIGNGYYAVKDTVTGVIVRSETAYRGNLDMGLKREAEQLSSNLNHADREAAK